MKKIYLSLVFLIFFIAYSIEIKACSPYGTPFVATQSISGGNLNIVWTSTTAWACDYWIKMEIVCNSQPFTGTPNYTSVSISKPSTANMNYPSWSIPLSAFCPGVTYKFRAKECANGSSTSCSGWSTTYTFTAPGTPPTLTASASPAVICPSQTSTLTSTYTGGCGSPTYSWSPGGQTTPNITVSPSVTTTYTVTIQDGCAGSLSTSVTVTIPPPPVAGTASATPNPICSGETTTLSLVGYQGNIQWQSGPSSTGPWTNIPGATTTPYTTAALVNSTTAPISVCFRAELTGCGPTVYSNAICVTINPIPTVTVPSNVTVCHGDNIAASNFTSPVTGTAFDWTNDNTAIGLGASGTGNIAAFTATNTTTNPITATIIVTPTANGCAGPTSSYTITVHALPTPDFTFLNVCFGTTTSFTDQSVGNGGTISNWNWDFTNNGIVNSTTQNPTNGYVSAGSYTAELMVQTADGCRDSTTKTVVVHPVPVANFSAASVCLSETTIFIESSTVTTGTITNWAWDFGDGNTSSLQQPTHLYATANTFNVSLTVTTDSGCTHNVVIPVTVYAKPTAAFTTADVCQNLAAQFNSGTSTGNGGTINQWDWDFDFITPTHTTDATTQNPSNNYASAGTYIVDLIVTTSDGCSDTISNPITIHPIPVASYTFTNECFGTAIDFVDNSNVSTGTITNWNWVFGNSNTSTIQNPSEMYATDGQYNVTLTVTSDNGCQDDVTQTVIVYPLPVVNFTPIDVCLLETTPFIDLSTVTTGTNVGWAWNFDDGTGSNLQNPTHTYGTEGVYQVKLIVTTNYGCKDSITKPVTVHPLPQVSFIPSVLDSCSPVIVDFTNNSSIISGNIVAWYWNFGNAGTSNQENPTNISFINPSHSSVATFGVSLMATSDEGCVGKDSVANMIKSYPIPLASFSYGPAPTDIYESEISFTDNSIIASQWLWDLGDGASSTVQNPVHLYADSGLYTVILYMENEYGCEDTTEKIIKINPVFVIFIPNAFTPDEDGINDYFFATGYGITQIETLIFDRWGELIFEGYELESKWDGTYKGTLAKTEVYSYKIKVRDVFGEWHDYIGKVSLIK